MNTALDIIKSVVAQCPMQTWDSRQAAMQAVQQIEQDLAELTRLRTEQAERNTAKVVDMPKQVKVREI